MAEGQLITAKTGNDPRVYLVRDNKKHWVINGSVIQDLGYSWDSIKHVSDGALEKLRLGIPITSINQKVHETTEFIYCIEDTWSDDKSIGVVGWAVGKKKPIKSLSIDIEGHEKVVRSWTDQPQIFEHFSSTTNYPVQKECGFMVVINRPIKRHVVFTANRDPKSSQKLHHEFARQPHVGDLPTDKNLEKRFRDIANNKHFSVLEVGSRISPGGVNKRAFFKKAGSYVGIDYLDGETVDVVGDAHELSKHFKRQKFDALYSDSVLEHLAVPWKAVIEMNKVLKKGGYVFHSAPACWPPHDMPWDFWRFSDAGMRSLFSKPFGFEVIDVEFTAPVSVHNHAEVGDEFARFPLSPAFGFVSVLARKTHNIDRRQVRFDFGLKDVVGKTVYPEWAD